MKAAIAFALLAFSAVAVAGDRTRSEMPGWITGAWARSEGNKWADEFWTPPRAGIMIGASRSGVGEKLEFWEHMRIVTETDRTIVFWAIVADQQPVRFVATKNTASEIIFENPAHDYPQRIRYWREGKELKAQISQIDGSNAEEFGFKMMGGN